MQTQLWLVDIVGQSQLSVFKLSTFPLTIKFDLPTTNQNPVPEKLPWIKQFDWLIQSKLWILIGCWVALLYYISLNLKSFWLALNYSILYGLCKICQPIRINLWKALTKACNSYVVFAFFPSDTSLHWIRKADARWTFRLGSTTLKSWKSTTEISQWKSMLTSSSSGKTVESSSTRYSKRE